MLVNNPNFERFSSFSTVSPVMTSHQVFPLKKSHFFFPYSNYEENRNLVHFQQQSFCLPSLVSGIAFSVITRNPFPTLLSFWECLPKTFAQQKIGSEFQVNIFTNFSQSKPLVIRLSNGNFVVMWESQQSSFDLDIHGQLFNENATTIGNEFQVNSYTDSYQSLPSGASFTNGNFVVTWSSQSQIFGQLFNENASKIGNEFQINTYTNNSQTMPSVASFNNGNFVVTWQSWGGSDYSVCGQLFSGNGTRIGNAFQVKSPPSGRPSIDSLDNHTFFVTWMSDDSSRNGIFGQLFDGNGTKIGNEFQINSYVNGDQIWPSAKSLNNGNFVVTWVSNGQDGSFYGVYGQLFDGNGTKIGNEFRVNSYVNHFQSNPSVTGLSDGNFVVTWDSFGQDGSLEGVFGQLFNGNGTKIGPEFQVNTYTQYEQMVPSVASLQNGNFVVTWTSREQVGIVDRVFGQLFNDILLTFSTSSSSTSTTSSSTSTTSRSSTISTTSSSTSTTSRSSTISTTSSSASTTSRSSTISTTPSSASTTSRSSTISTTPSSASTTSSSTSFIQPTSYSMLSSSLNNRAILWMSVGAGGLICFCMTFLGYVLIRKRRSQTEPLAFEEMRLSIIPYDVDSVEQRHKLIGKAFYQLSTLVREEAEAIFLQTGHLIPFPEGQRKFRYVIGSGQFGKIKVARRKVDGVFVASKKITGEKNIRVSEAEAHMQKEAMGDNVLPIYNTIRLEEALYHFMPLAGLGDGSTIQRQLAKLNQSPFALTILQFIAQNILTGLKTIHTKRIYHLDIKPDNLVFTKDGTAYITDFGCAQRPENRHLTGKALGDNRYFSPERLRACQEGTFDAEKADMWAAGVTLLQIFYNKEPLELFNLPHRLAARVERCDQAHFDEQLQRFSEVEKGSILWVIKSLLDTNPKKRFTATQALQASCFHGLNKTQQEKAFEEFRRETFAQHEGIEQSEVHLDDYGWIMQRVPEEERGQSYCSEIHQQFYGYSLTPDFAPESYQFTLDHVTAGSSSSSSGYKLTP